MKPMPAKPRSSIAHVEGSGTAPATVSVVTQFPSHCVLPTGDQSEGVGIIEIAAGLGILLLPRLAPYVVVGWLGGIITNLIILSVLGHGHTNVFWDIALRDFGLLLAALALARLAAAFAPQRLFHSNRS